LLAPIVNELKQNGGSTLPNFGRFTVRKTEARKALNPRCGGSIKFKAGKAVRFKASDAEEVRLTTHDAEIAPSA
jgi:DNA-binding protein HU-beta